MLIWIPPGNKMLLLEHIKRFLLSIKFCCRLQIRCVLYNANMNKKYIPTTQKFQKHVKIDQDFVHPSLYLFSNILWTKYFSFYRLVCNDNMKTHCAIGIFKLLYYWFWCKRLLTSLSNVLIYIGNWISNKRSLPIEMVVNKGSW